MWNFLGLFMMNDSISTQTRKLTAIALMSSLSFVGRMMFSFLPNVQPTTVIIILIVMYMGLYEGMMVATISMLMSNIYLGMGVWTIAQIISYAVIVLIVSFFVKKFPDYFESFALLAFFAGLMYGFIISLVQAPFFGWVSFIPYYISGLTYDFSHAIGNYFFFMILHKPLERILSERGKF